MFLRAFTKLKNVQLSRDNKIAWLTGIITVGFGAIVLFYYYRYQFFGRPFTEHQLPVAGFGDFTAPVDLWGRGAFTGVGFGLSYFPGMYLFVDMITGFYQSYPKTGAVGAFLASFIGFLAIYAATQLKGAGIAETTRRVLICTFMSYPVIFTFSTGNYEVWVFMCLVAFVTLYQRGKTEWSVLPLAIAISMKLFPAVFLVLLIADKKYREFLYACAGVAALTIYPLLIFDGGILDGTTGYLANLHASQKLYFDLMVMTDAGNHFGHSILNGTRVVMGSNFPPMQQVLLPWLILSGIIFATVSAYIILVETVLWKKIALLVICMCLLPYTSNDYKLLHFFIPLFLFINQKRDVVQPATFDVLYIVIFSLLLTLKSYVWFNRIPEDNLNVALNPLLMIVMMIAIMGTGIVSVARHKKLS